MDAIKSRSFKLRPISALKDSAPGDPKENNPNSQRPLTREEISRLLVQQLGLNLRLRRQHMGEDERDKDRETTPRLG